MIDKIKIKALLWEIEALLYKKYEKTRRELKK